MKSMNAESKCVNIFKVKQIGNREIYARAHNGESKLRASKHN